jgi:CO/xanthine dehydrogenase Mo-binding subunit
MMRRHRQGAQHLAPRRPRRGRPQRRRGARGVRHPARAARRWPRRSSGVPPRRSPRETMASGERAARCPSRRWWSGAYFAQIPLSATGFYRTPGIAWDKSVGQGRPFHYFAYGAAVTEVEVDGYTGMKRVRARDIVHDVGDSLNPGIDRGQIEGGLRAGPRVAHGRGALLGRPGAPAHAQREHLPDPGDQRRADGPPGDAAARRAAAQYDPRQQGRGRAAP